jgi:hypothetical protein
VIPHLKGKKIEFIRWNLSKHGNQGPLSSSRLE